jgi:DHA2 family multidrug resistance protein
VTEQTLVRTKPSINKWLVAIAVMSSAIIEVLDTSVVNVSLPHIAGSLSATTDEATWVLTSYLVANAIVLPLSGWLANYFGRKRLLMSVVCGFTVSSLLCGMAPNLPSLVFFRIMQGVTGGGLQPLSQAVLLEEFPRKEHGKAMAVWAMGIVVAPILGPTLGGWLTDNYSWRWVFYINLPIGIISLVLIGLYVWDPPYISRGKLRFDAWGLGMLVVGMGAFQIMLDKGQEEDWFASKFIVVLCVVAIVLLTAFVVRQLKVENPLVKFRLMSDRNFACGISLVSLMLFVLYGSLVLLPLFMQELLGWTAVTTGFWTGPRGIAIAVAMPVVGKLLGKGWDGRLMVAGGFAAASISYLAGYSHMNLNSGAWDIVWPQLIQGVGVGFIFVPLTVLTMSRIQKQDMGYASSLYSIMRNIGSSIGIPFVTTLIARRSQFHQVRLGEHVTAYDPRATQYLSTTAHFFANAGSDAVAAKMQGIEVVYRSMLQQASLMSFLDAFKIMGFVLIGVIPLIFIMKKASKKPQKMEMME